MARGRRPGSGDSRAAIAAAARKLFAELGYDRTTIRAVAAGAGVDPALVMHFFGSKQRLLVETMAVPFDVPEAVDALASGDRGTLGRRLAAFLLESLEQSESRAFFLGRLRASASEPEAARLVREAITRELVGPLAQRVSPDRPALRAGLVSSQLMGWVFARWVVEVEALNPLSVAEATAALGPTLQRYLVGALD
jgi:AcrR family transcriptional regulator